MTDTCGKCGLPRTSIGHDLAKDPFECLNDPKAIEAAKLIKFPDPKPLPGSGSLTPSESTTPIEFLKIHGKVYASLNDLALWVAKSSEQWIEKDRLFGSLNRMSDFAIANLPESFQVPPRA